MTISIPLVALIALVAYIAYRHLELRAWHAIVCMIRFPASRDQRGTANPELSRRDHPVAAKAVTHSTLEGVMSDD